MNREIVKQRVYEILVKNFGYEASVVGNSELTFAVLANIGSLINCLNKSFKNYNVPKINKTTSFGQVHTVDQLVDFLMRHFGIQDDIENTNNPPPLAEEKTSNVAQDIAQESFETVNVKKKPAAKKPKTLPVLVALPHFDDDSFNRKLLPKVISISTHDSISNDQVYQLAVDFEGLAIRSKILNQAQAFKLHKFLRNNWDKFDKMTTEEITDLWSKQ